MPHDVNFTASPRNPVAPSFRLRAEPRTDEVTELAARYSRAHGEAAAIACVWHLATKLLTEFGSANGSDLKPMVDLVQRSLRTHGAVAGVSDAAIQGALLDLKRAGETAAILHSLPD